MLLRPKTNCWRSDRQARSANPERVSSGQETSNQEDLMQEMEPQWRLRCELPASLLPDADGGQMAISQNRNDRN